MFGFGKSKTQDVRLTEKEINELKKNMSRSELKEFEKRQKQARADRDFIKSVERTVHFNVWIWKK